MAKIKYLKFQDSPVLVDKAYTAKEAKHANEATHATNADYAPSAKIVDDLPDITLETTTKNCMYVTKKTGDLYYLGVFGDRPTPIFSDATLYRLTLPRERDEITWSTSVSAGRYIYLFGGKRYYGGGSTQGTIDRFDTYTKTFEFDICRYTPNVTTPKGLFHNNKIYLFCDNGIIDIYDIATNTIRNIDTNTDINFSLSGVAIAPSGTIYLFGGYRNGSYINSIYSFSPVNLAIYEESTVLPQTPSGGCIAISNNEYIILIYNNAHTTFNTITKTIRGVTLVLPNFNSSSFGGISHNYVAVVDNLILLIQDEVPSSGNSSIYITNFSFSSGAIKVINSGYGVRGIDNLVVAQGNNLFSFGCYYGTNSHARYTFQLSFGFYTTYWKIQSNKI